MNNGEIITTPVDIEYLGEINYEGTKNIDDLKGFQIEIRTLTADTVHLEEKLISDYN